jgi:cytochrome P450
MTMTDVYWDPFDKAIDLDPHPVWRRLRDDHPVYRNDKLDFWALSRFADVDAAHRDTATFSSAHGTVLEIMGPEPVHTASIIFMDPPPHTAVRALVSRAFTPRRVSQLGDRVREICAELLDPYVGGGEFDFVQEFSAQLPSKVISSLLGVAEDEREEVRHVIDEMFTIDEEAGMINDVSFAARIKLYEYLSDQVRQRREHPTDDLLGALVEAELPTDDGGVRRLTDTEATDFGLLLVSAGTETVARFLGWACVLLEAHPDQRRELADDPSLIPNALEETLRYEAPSPVQGRWTTRDVELHGVTIPESSKVLLLTGSAGRDEREYPDADRYDIHRKVGSHMSFGHGIHFCLGASLARLEGRIGLEEVLRRFPEWEIDHERAVRLFTSTVRGYDQLPVRV